jgi:hypothetical protein
MPGHMDPKNPDPMCCDKNAMEWAGAWMGHKTPTAGKVGFMYMLAGGTDASNVDPYATKPTATNHWVKTGPHVMVVGGDAAFYDSYPKNADPDTSVPYVMWAGTPYQHLMAQQSKPTRWGRAGISFHASFASPAPSLSKTALNVTGARSHFAIN